MANVSTGISYGRVSDEEQAKGKSVENQLVMCDKYGEQKGITILRRFRDDGKSGRSIEGRPGFLDALDFIKENKVDYFLVSETDRFSRSAHDHQIVKQILKKHGCRLVAVNQPFTEMDTPESTMMDGIMSSINEFYSNLYGAKTSRAMLRKIEKGEWPGWAPIGYKNENTGTKDNPHNEVLQDENQSALVAEAFSLLATGGYNCTDLNGIMYSKGLRSRHGKALPKSSFVAMINSPFYYGMMEFKGQLYPGNHKPLIDKATYDACQARMAALNHHANRERKHSERFFLRSALQCGICGGRMTAEIHNQKNGASYYHCSLTLKKHSNVGQNIRADVLEELIAEQFRKIQFTLPLMERIVARAKEILVETHSGVDKQIRQVENRKMKLRQRRSNLEDDRADRVVDAETFRRKAAEYSREIAVLEQQLIELNQKRKSNIDIFARFMELTDDLHQTYMDAPPHLKRHLISLFFDRIAIKNRSIDSVDYTKIVQTMLENRAVIINGEWLLGLDSNQRPWR